MFNYKTLIVVIVIIMIIIIVGRDSAARRGLPARPLRKPSSKRVREDGNTLNYTTLYI